jgi:hypothetical protein
MTFSWLQNVIRNNFCSDGIVSQHQLTLHVHFNHTSYKDLGIKFGYDSTNIGKLPSIDAKWGQIIILKHICGQKKKNKNLV